MGTNPFPAASGYGNFPLGNWSPITFAEDLIDFNRKVTVCDEITNTDYIGQIAGMGSEVEIIKEPEISVTTYNRGKEVEPSDIVDEKITLLIDQGNMFSFTLDDIEALLSHVAWASKLMDSGMYALRKAYDANVLQDIVTNASTNANTTGVTIGFAGGSEVTPLQFIGRARTVLDDNDVIEGGRYMVASPQFFEQLENEDSSITDIQFTGEASGYDLLRSSKYGANRAVKGFTMYKSTNLPANTDVIYGNVNAVTSVQAISKSEITKREKHFGDLYKGLHVFGRKVVKPESVFRGTITFA